MKNRRHFLIKTISAVAGIVIVLGGCTKKTTRISPISELEPLTETVSVAAPIVPEMIDSAAIFESLMREALQNIYFDYNDYALKADAIGQLTAIGRILMAQQSVSIMIEGHCDARGTSEYNIGLGENRAKATKDWLVAYGIAGSKIQTNSYGKERLAVLGCTDEGCYQQNRRCEFKMVDYQLTSY